MCASDFFALLDESGVALFLTTFFFPLSADADADADADAEEAGDARCCSCGVCTGAEVLGEDGALGGENRRAEAAAERATAGLALL